MREALAGRKRHAALCNLLKSPDPRRPDVRRRLRQCSRRNGVGAGDSARLVAVGGATRGSRRREEVSASRAEAVFLQPSLTFLESLSARQNSGKQDELMMTRRASGQNMTTLCAKDRQPPEAPSGVDREASAQTTSVHLEGRHDEHKQCRCHTSFSSENFHRPSRGRLAPRVLVVGNPAQVQHKGQSAKRRGKSGEEARRTQSRRGCERG